MRALNMLALIFIVGAVVVVMIQHAKQKVALFGPFIQSWRERLRGHDSK